MGPSRLYWCSLNNILTGIQIWYGDYNPIVGRQHGDLSVFDDCQEKYFTDPVREINFFVIGSGTTT